MIVALCHGNADRTFFIDDVSTVSARLHSRTLGSSSGRDTVSNKKIYTYIVY
jgi:hypothetical protein